MLVIDQASSHVSNEFLEYLYNNNIEFLILPPGMTSFLQPCDISVNKVLKIGFDFYLNKIVCYMIM